MHHFFWLLTNWGSLSGGVARLPSVSEMQRLRSSGQTLHPLYLTVSSPTCTQPQGLLGQGVTGEKSFHFKSPCFCFLGRTQETSLSAELGGWYVTLCSGGAITIVLTGLCFGWVQFNPHFPVALTKKLPCKHRLGRLIYQSAAVGVKPWLPRQLRARTRYPVQNQKWSSGRECRHRTLLNFTWWKHQVISPRLCKSQEQHVKEARTPKMQSNNGGQAWRTQEAGNWDE